MTQEGLGAACRRVLLTAEPLAKAKATRALVRSWRRGDLAWSFDDAMPDAPARPAEPELLPANRMPKRGRGGSARGRLALLDRRLRALGSRYGAMPAHAGLWEAADGTKSDALARLAVVPMVLEARGLDVTPATAARFRDAGDEASARILARIYADEIRHVSVGTRWFGWVCARDDVAPAPRWQALVSRHFRGSLKPPFNDSARAAAGLTRDYYAPLAAP